MTRPTWHIKGHPGRETYIYAGDDTQNVIAEFRNEDDAIAATVAVNNHDALLAAAKGMIELLDKRILVRNTSEDGNFKSYMTQGVTLVQVVSVLTSAIASCEERP